MSNKEERPDAVSTRLVDEILDEQRRLWTQGRPVLVEALLQRLPALSSDSNIILDLIYNEIVLREKAGECPQQQEYAQRFPQLREELALQFEVDRGLDWQAVTNASSDDMIDSRPFYEPSGGTPYPSLPGYAVTGLLGRGGTGVIYKARQLNPDRSVAVKVVLAGMRQQAIALIHLRAEAAKLTGLRHPNFCPIFEIGVDAGRLFVAQERVEGSLAKRQAETQVSPLQAVQWLAPLARAVHDIHRLGIVHGNLTAANVLMSYNGTLKITDIGLARFLQPIRRQDATLDGLAGNQDVPGPTDDVHALGVILYILLAPRSSVAGSKTPIAVRTDSTRLPPEVPRDLETICLHCLQVQPARRYANAAELADDLTAFLAGRPIKARRAGFLERVGRSVRRWNFLASDGRPSSQTQRMLEAATQHCLRADRIQLTLDLTCRLMRTKGRDDLIRMLAEAAAWLTDAELVTIFIVDRERGDLQALVSRGMDVEELRLPLDVGIAGSVVATGERINLPDAHADSRFDREADRRTGVKTRNLLALPLTSDGVVLGVVQAINKREGAFSAEDTETLSGLVAAAAVAFERAV